ncbi:MAG: hypothetical protein IPM69_06150 [Ignavibacteria bacterium]|nr:hypothetical protein [Ignavibacteria bacterium]
MKKNVMYLYGFVFAVVIISCSHSKPNPIPRDVSKARITMTRTACYGKCPIYTVTIYGTGVVEFEGFANTKLLGKHEAQIPVDSVRSLIAEIEKHEYYALNDSYETYQMTDLASVITEVTIDDRFKKINHYKGDLTTPQHLSSIEVRIDEIATTHRWLE